MGELGAVPGVVVFAVDVGAVAAGTFATGALTFGVARGAEGGVTGDFTFDGTSFLAGVAADGTGLNGATEGGEGGFTAAASSVFSARGAEGGVTGEFIFDGTSFFAGVGEDGAALTGATEGGEGGFTAAASSVFSAPVAGGGSGWESGDETAAGGLSVPREHAWTPIPSANTAIKQSRLDNITHPFSNVAMLPEGLGPKPNPCSCCKWSSRTTKWRSPSNVPDLGGSRQNLHD